MAYAVQGGTVKVIPIDFDAQGNPVQKPLFDTEQAVGTGRAWLRSGQFDWSGAFDQAALLISSGQENSLRILTFDQNLTVQSGPVATIPASICVGDVAVGNFDSMQANPTPPPDTIRNPNLQLAAFLQTDVRRGKLRRADLGCHPRGHVPRASFRWGRGIRSTPFPPRRGPSRPSPWPWPPSTCRAARPVWGRPRR